MISRKIQAPGVEVNEIDLSQYGNLNLADNTVVLLNGFSDKGDNQTTKIVTSIPDFTTEYGYPTNEAERYLYNAVKQTLVHGGIPAIFKMPYQNSSLSTYSACRYIVGGSYEISSLTLFIDVESLFPTITGTDYNLTSLFEVLNNVQDIASLNGTLELSDVQTLTSEIQQINISLGLEEHSLSSVQEISANLMEIDERLRGDESLDYSTQVGLFNEFINGICNFESYGLPLSTYNEISALLFNTRFCLANVHEIYNSASELSAFDESSPQSVIYWTLRKNGYSDYETFKEAFSKTFTKSEFLQSAKYLEGTQLSIDQNVIDAVSVLKYTDLARIEGMTSFTAISADTSFKGSITNEQYDDYVIGEKNTLSNGTITIVDITRSKYEKDKLVQNDNLSSAEFIGIVPVIVSPVNALYYQNLLEQNAESTFEYNIVSELSTAEGLSTIIEDLEIPLSSDSNHGTSLGRIAESYFPKIEYFSPTKLDNTLLHKVGVVVFKMAIDPANNNKISFTPVEAFFGSLNRKDKDLITNATDFLEDIVNNQSQYINMFIKMSDTVIGKLLKESTIMISNQPVFSLGFSSEDCKKDISIELIKDSLRLAFDHLQNPNTLKIDIVADAGMSNIAQYIANTTFNNIGRFDIADNYSFPIKNGNAVSVWKSIIDLYDDFCKNVRKDCMFIADSPRNFCLVGNQKMVRRSNPSNTIENTILPSLRFMVDFDTSYGAGYCNWFRCIDDTLRYYMWMPPSVKVIEAYLVTDNQYNFWDAPAGLKRGVMTETFDVAFNPAEKDAEKLYINRWNYAVSYPLEGIILEGQKTFQKNRTAFDRVNIRRLFLRIEKDIRMMARSFLYEPLSTRNLQKFRDMVNTYLQDIKTNDGIREFYVICDGRNNTDQTIDNNEMHCSIGVMPVKTIEFIVLNFICTNQSANVEEVTSQNI